ncbi:MAG: dicarboxylate/amino acid:cation symporter [Pirellulales bacterium]|nr:dicarboxylate/amino acid:cation symporter [Pirellulales bacterium]
MQPDHETRGLAQHWQILIGMLAGAIIGILLNSTQGRSEAKVDVDALPPGLTSLAIVDSPDRVEIRYKTTDGDQHKIIVDGRQGADADVPTIDKLKSSHPGVYRWFADHGRSTSRIVGDSARKFGGLFLRMLQMVAIPLVVSSLISGVMGLGDASQLGKMFGKTMTYYLCTSFLAIVTGLIVVNVIQPGVGQEMVFAGGEKVVGTTSLSETLFAQLESLIPKNPFHALANGDFLSIISFSIMFAICALIVGGKTASFIKDFFESCFEVMMQLTLFIIMLAPYGVFLLMLYVTSTHGASVFSSLAWYMCAVLTALGIHACITLPLILRYFAKRSPWEYARSMSPALLTAFSTASSNGTLPLTMACVEKRAGIDNKTSSFVLPLGATINMDGTALYEAVAVLFIAQLHHGESLPLSYQLIVALTALLVSIGAAGIPHAGLVMMVIILQAVNLPIEMQGIILAVDRVLDMCRTSVNVWSDSCGCAVVGRET